MPRISLAVAVCTTILSACSTTQPPKPEPVPKELVPAGFSAADCKVVKPAEAITQDGPGGSKVTTGMRPPQVECTKHTEGAVTVKSTPTCHTKTGKELPLADCCMTDSGDPLPACTPKMQAPE
jgi:hypothetical protein